MKNLLPYIEICDIHAQRIRKGLEHIAHLTPLSPNILSALTDTDLGFLELVTSRFSKLQDTIGQKIFPNLLEALQETVRGKSFLDILHRLEALGILENTGFWIHMHEVRNLLAHEYPDNVDMMTESLNQVLESVYTLLEYWEWLKLDIKHRLDSEAI